MVGDGATEVCRPQLLHSHHLGLLKAIRKVTLGATYQLSSVRDCDS